MVQQQVLRLDVPVRNPVLVAIVERRHKLLEVAAGRRLGEPATADDPGEELPAGGELHDKVDPGPGGHHLVDPEDVGVGLEPPHGGNLTEDLGLEGGELEGGLVLVDDLDRDVGVVGQGQGLVDLGEAAPAEEPAQLVLVLEGGGGGGSGGGGGWRKWWWSWWWFHGLVAVADVWWRRWLGRSDSVSARNKFFMRGRLVGLL